jgi:hypothetical protein
MHHSAWNLALEAVLLVQARARLIDVDELCLVEQPSSNNTHPSQLRSGMGHTAHSYITPFILYLTRSETY